jgi:serine/threonine protein phosphatase 1
MKMIEVRCCQRLPANLRGRDFVVGDLHGQRRAFERQLERMNFDVGVDRVLSVGDLVNRGPHSLDTLALIEQPWFHAVLGNHEMRVLSFLGFFRSRHNNGEAYVLKKGGWLIQALHTHRRRVLALAEQAATLPLAIRVGERENYQVMHGDLQPLGTRQAELFAQDTIDIHLAERLTASRGHLNQVLASDLKPLRFEQHIVDVSSTPKGPLPLTYVGHSPMPKVTVHKLACVRRPACGRSGDRWSWSDGADRARTPQILVMARWRRGGTQPGGQSGASKKPRGSEHCGMSTTPGEELELKFRVPMASLPALTAELSRPLASAKKTRLRALYFDSADRQLAQAGLALRLRREGRVWIQTLKATKDGSLSRWEHEVRRPDATLDLHAHDHSPAGDRLQEALNCIGSAGTSLEVRLQTDMQRLHRVIRTRGAVVEVALDVGSIGAAGQSLSVKELEFELLSGSVSGLLALARRWGRPIRSAV